MSPSPLVGRLVPTFEFHHGECNNPPEHILITLSYVLKLLIVPFFSQEMLHNPCVGDIEYSYDNHAR